MMTSAYRLRAMRRRLKGSDKTSVEELAEDLVEVIEALLEVAGEKLDEDD